MPESSSDPEDAPVLEEAPSGVDTSSAAEVSELFSDGNVTNSMVKVAVLEKLLAAVTRDCSFNDFMYDLLIGIMQAVKSEAGSIFEVDPGNSSLFFRSVVGSSSDRVMNFVIPNGQGLVDHVAESKRPIVVDKVSDNKLHLKSIEMVVGFEAKNLVAIPILVRGKVYGVLELLNRIGEECYTSADVELLTYLSNMAAKVIEIRLMIAWSQKEQSQYGVKAA